MKGYTSKTEIENYLLIDIDESFVDQVNRWITGVEEYIDHLTGRSFIADATATVRKYDGDNTGTLLIDDCVAVEEVTIGTDDPLTGEDESGDEGPDYYLYPANTLPKTRIRLASGTFPRWGPQNVSVKAKWGYSVAVPEDIRNAATVLLAGIINFSNSNEAEGDIKSMSIGRYTVTYKDDSQWHDFERIPNVFTYYKKYNL